MAKRVNPSREDGKLGIAPEEQPICQISEVKRIGEKKIRYGKLFQYNIMLKKAKFKINKKNWSD
jgi:hypothetical protein